MHFTWQNLTWLFFHKLSLNQDPNKNEYYILFFNSFKTILPCSFCRNHYIKMIEEDQNNLRKNINKKNAFNLSIDLHNNVNKRIYKEVWTYDDAKKYYSSFFLNFDLIKRFLTTYIYYNFKKGPIKTEKLFEMIRSFSHIFPRHHIRKKLVHFQNKIKPNKENFQKWITAYILIIKTEMR